MTPWSKYNERVVCNALKNISQSGRILVYKHDNGTTSQLQITDIETTESGCHRCKVRYDAISIYGKFDDNNFEGNMNTYDFYPCKCVDGVDAVDAVDGFDANIMFKVTFNGCI